jgi:hypothetical protein
MSANPEKLMLDKLADWVKGQGEPQQERARPVSWVTGLVIAAIAMMAIAFFYWRSWRQGKKLAKLLHEKDVLEQKAIQAEIDSKIKKTNIEAARRRRAASEAWVKAKELDEQIRAATERKTRTTEEIDALKNWRDVDRYLDGDGDGGG